MSASGHFVVSDEPENQCNRQNEVWSDSLAACQKTCATRDVAFKCIPKEGCICKEGFIRQASIYSICIPINDCQG